MPSAHLYFAMNRHCVFISVFALLQLSVLSPARAEDETAKPPKGESLEETSQSTGAVSAAATSTEPAETTPTETLPTGATDSVFHDSNEDAVRKALNVEIHRDNIPANLRNQGQSFPTLTHALEQSRRHGLPVKMADRYVKSADSHYRASGMIPISNPYLEVFFLKSLDSTTQKDVAIDANLWLPIELSNQRGKRLDEAESLTNWRKAGLAHTVAATQGDVIENYGKALAEAARVKALSEMTDVATQQARYFKERLAAQDATIKDSSLSELQEAQFSMQESQSRAALTQALVALSMYTGGQPFDAPRVEQITDLSPPALPEIDLDGWLERSPEIVQLNAEIAYYAKKADLVSRSAQEPVSFILSAARGDAGDARLGGGLAWTFPVARRNPIDRADADNNRLNAIQRRTSEMTILKVRLEGHLLHWRQLSKAITQARETAIPAAQTAINASEQLVIAGKGDLIPLLTARKTMLELEMQLLDLVEIQWHTLAEIVRLTGKLP